MGTFAATGGEEFVAPCACLLAHLGIGDSEDKSDPFGFRFSRWAAL